METAEKVTHLITDKTGTLTAGKPEVVSWVGANNTSERDLLKIAASLESHSEHPLVRAIVKAAKKEQIELHHVTGFESITGGGVSGKIDGKSVLIGKEKFLTESKVTISEGLKNEARRLQEKAQTTVWLGVDGKVVGILGIADPIKETTKLAIRQLHDMHLKVIMCTGDNHRTAEAVARELGIDEFKAEVMPNEKIDIVKKLKSEGAIVAMAGD